MRDIVIALVSGIVVYFITTGFSKWRKSRIEYKSTLTGTWTQLVYENYPNEIRAKDTVNCKHNKKTNEISGDISRFFPETDKKEWRISGRFSNDIIYLTFWPKRDKKTSSGTIIMNFNEGQDKFMGQYMKVIIASMNTSSLAKEFIKTNVVWGRASR